MITVRDIVDELITAQDIRVQKVLLRLIIQSLSPRQMQAYSYLLDQYPRFVPSMEVAKRFDLKLNQTGNILKSLHDLGLLIKDIRTGATGLHCAYKAKLNY